MIDTHCHLEQPDYEKDRDIVIARCRKKLKAIITCCGHPLHFELTMQLVKRFEGFVFATASIHPKYVKEFTDEKLDQYLQLLQQNNDRIIAIGETGLDYNWITEARWQAKQRDLFVRFITFAKHASLPLVIHSRNATQEAVDILEAHQTRDVQMHMFTDRSLLKRVVENNWMISINTLLLRSKDVKRIVRDCPLTQIMLETDSPWLGIGSDGNIKPKHIVRNTPQAVELVAAKIAEIKKRDLREVTEQTTNNAKRFFKFDV